MDGRADPARVVAELLKHQDAGRLRSRFLRELIDEFHGLRGERDAARGELARVKAEIETLRADRDSVDARVEGAEAYADTCSARLFEIESAVRDALPSLERADAAAAERLAAILAGDDDASR